MERKEASYTAMLLLDTGEETRDIDKGHQRDVEGVAEADPAGPLDRGVDVQDTGGVVGLVGDEGDGAPVHAAKAHHQVGGELGHDLKEVLVVHHLGDHVLDVVGLVGVVGHQGVEGRGHASRAIVGFPDRGGLAVGEGKEVKEGADPNEKNQRG